MKILIIRHAEPIYVTDSLTEKGMKEAQLLALRLSRLDIDDIYCSPLGRARMTADATCAKTGKEYEILPWLREFSGKMNDPVTGKRTIPWNLEPRFWTKQPQLFYSEEWLNHQAMSAGDVREVYETTGKSFDELLEKYGYKRDGYIYRTEENSRKTIALFCHFGIGCAILSHITGIAAPLIWQNFFMPTSSVTTLITEERVRGEVIFKCMQLGDTSHLYKFDEPTSHMGLYPEFFIENSADSGSKA